MTTTPGYDPFGLIGQVLDGQFRVDRYVGEGGFSVVYRGHHLGLNEPIAIKCLKLPGQLGSALVESFVRRFRDESRLHYKLSQGSLFIVRSIASGTTMAPTTSALVPYMVLEWLDGCSLADDLADRRARRLTGRSLPEVIKLLDPAVDALAHAHVQGVVHRDLNPGNLFLAQTRDGVRTKVLDFGVAKIVSDHALEMGPRAQTFGHIRIFAPAYGAPEQFDEKVGPIGTWTDVYALGLIVLEMLRDRAVMEGEHIGEYAMRALDAEHRPTPRALGIEVGENVERLMRNVLSVSPNDRPQDAGEMWGTLKAAMIRDGASGAGPFLDPPTPIVGMQLDPTHRTLVMAGANAPRPFSGTVRMDSADLAAARGERATDPDLPRPPAEPPPEDDDDIDSTRTEIVHYDHASGTVSYPHGQAPPHVLPSAVSRSEPPPAQTPQSPAVAPPGPGDLEQINTASAQYDRQKGVLTYRTGHTRPPAAPAHQTPVPPRPPMTFNTPSQSSAPTPFVGTVPHALHASSAPPPAHPSAPPNAPSFPPPTVPSVVPSYAPPEPERSSGSWLGIAFALVGLLVLAGGAFSVWWFVLRAPAPRPAPTVAPPASTPLQAASSAPPAPASTPSAAPTEAAPPPPSVSASASPPPPATNLPAPVPPTTSTVTVAVDAGAGFDPKRARSALSAVNSILASCKQPGPDGGLPLTGDGQIQVVFDPAGTVSSVSLVGPPFAGTPAGECVLARFRTAKMAPFEGSAGTVVYTFTVPR